MHTVGLCDIGPLIQQQHEVTLYILSLQVKHKAFIYSAMYEYTLKTLKERNSRERKDIRIMGSESIKAILLQRRMFTNTYCLVSYDEQRH